MATIETRPSKTLGTRYRVKWRIGGVGDWDGDTFDNLAEARRYKAVIEAFAHHRPGAEELAKFGFGHLAMAPPVPVVELVDWVVVAEDGPSLVTLERYARDYVKGLVKPSRETRRKYLERLDNYVFPDLGDRLMVDITRRMMRDWQQGMMDDGLSPKTIANVRGETLYPMFEASCLPGEDGEPALRASNPLRGLALPERVEFEREIIETAEEAALFIGCAYEIDVPAAELIVTGLATGMRWGELAGLPVRAVNSVRGTITVQQVLVREHHQWVVRARPKTRDGYREIPVPAEVMAFLIERCAGRPKDALVFTAPEGGPWRYSQFYDGRWERIRDLAIERGLDKRMTIHGLRHSNLTHLASEGIDLGALKQLAGHKRISTTYDIYVHANRKHHSAVRELVRPFVAPVARRIG